MKLHVLLCMLLFYRRGQTGNFTISLTSPSITKHREDLAGQEFIFNAECTTKCRLRITIGLSCPHDAAKPHFEAVPFTINDAVAEAVFQSYTWTSDVAYGVSLRVEDQLTEIRLTALPEYASLNANNSKYTYAFTVLSDQFFNAPPYLYTHVVQVTPLQSMKSIGAGTDHIFVAPSGIDFNLLYFEAIQLTENLTAGGGFVGYVRSLHADGDESRLVDIFSMDNRTKISALLWSLPVATFRFGSAKFDISYEARPLGKDTLWASVGACSLDIGGSGTVHSALTLDGSDGIDMRYTDQLGYGYPTENLPTTGNFLYAYSFPGDPLKYFYLTIHNLTRGTLSYQMSYRDNENVTHDVALRIDEVPDQVYCSSRIFRVVTFWLPSLQTAKMRARLEWHREDNPLRKCTEIIPDRPATTPSSTTVADPQTSERFQSVNIQKVGIIVGAVLGIISAVALLVMFCLWRRKRLLEFEEMIAHQIREVTARRQIELFIKKQAWVNLSANAEWEIDPTALYFGEEICKNALHLLKKTTLYGALPCTDVYPALKVIYPITPAGYEVVAKSAMTENAKIDILREIKALKSIPPHAHLLSLIGCSTDPSNPMIVTEYCAFGDLLTLVKKIRRKAADEDLAITFADFPLIGWQIADGLSFLASVKIIHRDVAARNVLVTKEKMIKLCDFAQSRQGEDYHYAQKLRQNRTPLRWCAPEAAKEGKFSEKSDVTEIMQSCWRLNPKLRPKFDKLSAKLRGHFQMVKHNEYYMNLSVGDNPWEEEAADSGGPKEAQHKSYLEKIS